MIVVEMKCLAVVLVNYCMMTCDVVWSVYLCLLVCV